MMNPSIKLQIGSAGYCALLACLNWSRSVERSHQNGVFHRSSVDPIALAVLLAVGIVFYLLYRCVRAALRRLEIGRSVREGRWIKSWGVVVYALPLLFHLNSTARWKEADGAFVTVTGGYGHNLSIWVFVFAILGMFLFQMLTRLSTDDEGRNKMLPPRFARG